MRPRPSDTIADDVQKVLNQGKRATVALAIKQVPRVATTYKSLEYADRSFKSTNDQPMDQPIEYFNLFFTPEQCQTFAINTKANARRKRAEKRPKRWWLMTIAVAKVSLDIVVL